jgi:phosphoribosylaminoimidazole-succinocarboxamide synthase
MPAEPLMQSQVPGRLPRRGKVRDVYDLGDALAIVATDRISAFDWVMPNGIPNKGRVLTAMTLFWLKWLNVPNHFLSADLADLPPEFHQQELEGRTMKVRKTTVIPVECVARGYLLGSGWKEYQAHGTVCGITLDAGLPLASKLREPIFTPATKAEEGHDENISFEQMAKQVGADTAAELKAKTLDVYRRAAEYAESRGLILADTKFEWGRLPVGARGLSPAEPGFTAAAVGARGLSPAEPGFTAAPGEIILIDEVLTPDSSRYWPKDTYRAGASPPSFDKQFVRDWLETTPWDKASPPPPLPDAVVAKTVAKYQEALDRLTK